MRLNIAHRLLMVVCILALIMGATGAILIRYIDQTRYDDEVKMAKKAVNVAMLDTSYALERILIRTEELPEEEDTGWTRDEQANVRDEYAKAAALTEAFARNYPEQRTLNTHYADFLGRLQTMVTQGEPVRHGALNQLESSIIEASGPAALSTDYAALRMIGIGLFVLGVIAPFIVYFQMRSLITLPLADLSARLYGLTNEDFDSDVPHTDARNEMGDIAFSLDVLRHTYRRAKEVEGERLAFAEERAKRQEVLDTLIEEFRGRTSGVIEAVGMASGQLSSASERILSSVDAAQRHASSIDETVHKSAVDVKEASQHAEEAYQAMNAIAQSSNTAQKVSADADTDVDAAIGTVSELADATDRITGVTHLIRKITERINLLALNAGIESARAGEAGKGFVVVAQEVKILAAQTKKATEEIIDNIALLQEKSEAASNALGSVKRRVSKIREGNEQEHHEVELQRRAVNELSYNMKGANGAMTTIQKSIATVRESVDTVQHVSRNVSETGRSLNVNANILSQEVRKFLDDINKAS